MYTNGFFPLLQRKTNWYEEYSAYTGGSGDGTGERKDDSFASVEQQSVKRLQVNQANLKKGMWLMFCFIYGLKL